jgi:hypothetical protein
VPQPTVLTHAPSENVLIFLAVDFYFLKGVSIECSPQPTGKGSSDSGCKESFLTNLFKLKKHEGYSFVYNLSTFVTLMRY